MNEITIKRMENVVGNKLNISVCQLVRRADS